MSIVQTLIGSIVTSGGEGGLPPSTYPVMGSGAYTTFASSANQTMGTAQEYSGAEVAQVLIGPANSNALSMDQVVTVVDSINGHTPLPT